MALLITKETQPRQSGTLKTIKKNVGKQENVQQRYFVKVVLNWMHLMNISNFFLVTNLQIANQVKIEINCLTLLMSFNEILTINFRI